MASKLFEDIFTDCGSVVKTCEFCGVTHFSADDLGGYDGDELSLLEEMGKEEPGKYKSRDCSIGSGFIGGKQFVWQCGCNGTQKYEDFIWENRKRISEYIKRRLENKINEIEEILKNLEEVK